MIFCDFYLPGYKSGGGVWTIVNLVDRFYDRYDIFIVTRNYDSKGDTATYTTVRSDDWNEVENASVFYFSPGTLTLRKTAHLVSEIKPDAIFLNSAFSMPVLKFLSARRCRMISDMPVVVAPCGEFSDGALSIKPLKKQLFLKCAGLIGLFSGVLWKASSDAEKEEILAVAGKGAEIMVAPDLVPRSILPDYSQETKPLKVKGSVKFVFISRVVPKKNVDFLLELLLEIHEGHIELDIIGPAEDQDYLQKCQDLVAQMSPNIDVNFSGGLPWLEALTRVSASHFLVLPTLNENFGYVFLEGLAAGCPLLISDRNMWTDIDERGVGWRIPLERPEQFVKQIERCLAMEDLEYSEMSRRARQYAVDWIARPEIDEATARVLDRVMNSARSVTDG